MSWHIADETIAAYADGRADHASAFSLESHVLVCASCRDAVAAYVDVAQVDRSWAGVRDAIERPRLRPAERVLIRAGVREDLARLLVVTPVLRASWLIAVAISLGLAVTASRMPGGEPTLFLALAPVLPLIGVALAYGAPMDPAWEVGLASPTGGFRLMLVRALGVLAVSLALAMIATLALPGLGWNAAVWLIPSVALTAVCLALASTVPVPVAASAVLGAWLVALVVSTRTGSGALHMLGGTGQVVFGSIAIIAAVMVVVRRDAFERRGI